MSIEWLRSLFLRLQDLQIQLSFAFYPGPASSQRPLSSVPRCAKRLQAIQRPLHIWQSNPAPSRPFASTAQDTANQAMKLACRTQTDGANPAAANQGFSCFVCDFEKRFVFATCRQSQNRALYSARSGHQI